MSRHRRHDRHNAQIVGVIVGITIPLVACATLVSANSTGVMPIYATIEIAFGLLVLSTLLGAWVWVQTTEHD
ncbi:MAG: hypothetical protein H7Y22_03340 [Gemmatimonadaceae bacterium]|nr:hypothetical protein [Gloeobacterales cyanobacterium ES-bin-141]